MLTRHPERPPLCATAPLLWGLIPLMFGIACADSSRPVVACICVASLLAPFLPRLRLSTAPLVLCFLAGFCCHRMAMDAPHPDWNHLPPREAGLSIEILELFNTRNEDCFSGIGNILQADIPHDTLSGNKISFYLDKPDQEPGVGRVGESFSCRGMVTHLPFLESHDGFQKYLISRDIFITINRGSATGKISPAPRLQQIRAHHFDRFQRILRGNPEADNAGNVLASMLLGDRRLLTDEQITLYRNSGTYHLFAVSGLHVGCMGVFIAGLLRLCRFKVHWILPVVLSSVWYYVWLTGSSPSSVRSGIMISCLMSSRLVWRQGHLFPALVASAWLVLLTHPAQMFSLGFQLSYSVVASIILIGLPLAGFLKQAIRRLLPDAATMRKPWRILLRTGISLLEITSISISAGCVSMPLIIQHFNLYTPAGVFMGILLNPVASATIMMGAFVMLLSLPLPEAAGMAASLAWPLIWFMEWLIGCGTRIPGAYSTRVWIFPQMGTMLVTLTISVAWLLQLLRQQNRRPHALSYFIPVVLVLMGLGFGLLDA